MRAPWAMNVQAMADRWALAEVVPWPHGTAAVVVAATLVCTTRCRAVAGAAVPGMALATYEVTMGGCSRRSWVHSKGPGAAAPEVEWAMGV